MELCWIQQGKVPFEKEINYQNWPGHCTSLSSSQWQPAKWESVVAQILVGLKGENTHWDFTVDLHNGILGQWSLKASFLPPATIFAQFCWERAESKSFYYSLKELLIWPRKQVTNLSWHPKQAELLMTSLPVPYCRLCFTCYECTWKIIDDTATDRPPLLPFHPRQRGILPFRCTLVVFWLRDCHSFIE